MFTLMFHCLEVLAMNASGATVNKIVSMGSDWSSQAVSSTLRKLEAEGYVKRWKAGRTTVWSITDKAVEYCGTIERKHEEAHTQDDIDAVNAAQANMTTDEQAVDNAMRTAIVTVNEVHKHWNVGPDDGRKVNTMLAISRLFGMVANRQCELNYNLKMEAFPNG